MAGFDRHVRVRHPLREDAIRYGATWRRRDDRQAHPAGYLDHIARPLPTHRRAGLGRDRGRRVRRCRRRAPVRLHLHARRGALLRAARCEERRIDAAPWLHSLRPLRPEAFDTLAEWRGYGDSRERRPDDACRLPGRLGFVRVQRFVVLKLVERTLGVLAFRILRVEKRLVAGGRLGPLEDFEPPYRGDFGTPNIRQSGRVHRGYAD